MQDSIESLQCNYIDEREKGRGGRGHYLLLRGGGRLEDFGCVTINYPFIRLCIICNILLTPLTLHWQLIGSQYFIVLLYIFLAIITLGLQSLTDTQSLQDENRAALGTRTGRVVRK